MKLTKPQQEILRGLRKGGRISVHFLGGEQWKGKRLRESTVQALYRTGELVLVHLQGKRAVTQVIVHERCIKEAGRRFGKQIPVKDVEAIFEDGLTYSQRKQQHGKA